MSRVTRRHQLASQLIPDRLREARERKGLSQAQLGVLVGYGQARRKSSGKWPAKPGQGIGEIERRRVGVTVALCWALAQALGVEPAWLAFGVDLPGGDKTGWGARIREARLAKGLSQYTLAESLGFSSNASVAVMEKEKGGLDIALAERLGQALGVSPVWLAFGLKEDE